MILAIQYFQDKQALLLPCDSLKHAESTFEYHNNVLNKDKMGCLLHGHVFHDDMLVVLKSKQ
jgi:hypothetical protein